MKVRFAPSPTGYLHIGGARTALFNYLYTKKNNGTMLLRIEDTDINRSSKEMVAVIIEGLKWLGIEWDEGPFYQSENFNLYQKFAELLKQNNFAYPCFCSADEIEKRKTINKTYKYDRKCLDISDEEKELRIKNGIKPILRFFIPEGITSFKDKIHKEISVKNEELDDFVLLKSDGSPTYHLSVVVDDNNMEITHVIRGDDHLSNTFKQILLYKAFNFKIPKFFHLPLILGKDKKKLSKRHGETSVLEFKKGGYLPEAVLTYLAQLSWNPGDHKKVFLKEELIKKIDFSKLSKNSPEFDYEKLNFLNSRAIQLKPVSEIYKQLIEDKEFKNNYRFLERNKIEQFITLIKPRMKTLLDIKDKFYIYFNNDLQYKDEDLNNVISSKSIIDGIIKFIEKLRLINQFDAKEVEHQLRELTDNLSLKAADLIHPCRLALTTETVSPGIFEVFEFFGKDESIRRLIHFTERIRKNVVSD